VTAVDDSTYVRGNWCFFDTVEYVVVAAVVVVVVDVVNAVDALPAAIGNTTC